MTDETKRIRDRGDQRDRDNHSISGAIGCALYAAAFALVCVGVLMLGIVMSVLR